MIRKSYTVYKLHFTAPFHFGDARDDLGSSLKSLSSDSMYAAITATLVQLGRHIPENGSLSCVLSALFPFYQKDAETECVYFFPKPLSAKLTEMSPTVSLKEFKRISWVDLTFLETLLTKELGSAEPLEVSIKGSFLTHCTIDPGFMASTVVRRVAVARNQSESIPFYMERVSFEDYSGLFFLVEGDTGLIDEALPVLSIEGIGMDRHVGNGSFEYEKTSLTLNLPEQVDYGYSLSTFIPESQEQLSALLDGEACAYDLSRRGGWISSSDTSGIRKNAIYAFMPGSVLHTLYTGEGKIVNLAPESIMGHPVFRCGEALVLPIIAE